MYRITRSKMDDVVTWLVYQQTKTVAGPLARLILWTLGVDIPRGTTIGPGLVLVHAPAGIVIHPYTRIGKNVTIFHGVTVGRADPWEPDQDGPMRVIIEDGAILATGAVVLARSGHEVRVRAGTIVGANAVLLQSTGVGEVWAGNPARRVGLRGAVDAHV